MQILPQLNPLYANYALVFYKAKIAANIPNTPVKETPRRSVSAAADLLEVAALAEEPVAVEPPIPNQHLPLTRLFSSPFHLPEVPLAVLTPPLPALVPVPVAVVFPFPVALPVAEAIEVGVIVALATHPF
jgi:hypothetical protein